MTIEMSAVRSDYNLQAEIFGTYLLPGVTIAPTSKELFAQTMRKTEAALGATDAKLLDMVLAKPRLLSFVDAGAALLYPDAEIRRRLYIMFAVLEASTEYWDYFLPKKRKATYLLTVAGAGIRSVYRASIGVIIIKMAV